MKVSIILTCYNASQWGGKIMGQLAEQKKKFPQTELICIDDGSTDDVSYMDVNGWTVIHQRNKGAYAARNVGLDIASGSYVTFVDADDEVLPNYLETLYKYEGKEMVSFRYMTDEGLAGHPKSHQALWAFLFKTELFSGLRFDENKNVGGDYPLIQTLIARGTNIFLAPEAIYHYHWYANPDSLCKRYNSGELPMFRN